MAEQRHEGLGVPSVWIERHHADPGEPAAVATGQPAGDGPGGAVHDDIEQAAGDGVDEPGHVGGVAQPVGPLECRLVDAQGGDVGEPSESSTSGWPTSRTGSTRGWSRLSAALAAGDPNGEVTAWQVAQLVHGLYAAPDLVTARRTLELLYTYADASRVPEARRFVRTMRRWEPEVLAYFTTGGASNGPTEAVNLTIKSACNGRPAPQGSWVTHDRGRSHIGGEADRHEQCRTTRQHRLGSGRPQGFDLVGVLRPGDTVPDVERIFHDEDSVRRLIARFAEPSRLRCATKPDLPATGWPGCFAA